MTDVADTFLGMAIVVLDDPFVVAVDVVVVSYLGLPHTRSLAKPPSG